MASILRCARDDVETIKAHWEDERESFACRLVPSNFPLPVSLSLFPSPVGGAFASLADPGLSGTFRRPPLAPRSNGQLEGYRWWGPDQELEYAQRLDGAERVCLTVQN